MGLRGEVFLGHGIHRAFETHAKLGDLAFGQSDDGDAREAYPLENGGHVLLVAADAVQRLGKHRVKSLGLNIGHEFLNAGMDQGSAGDGTVGITLRYRPALAGGVFPALAQLILDGSVALVIGRIAGIVPSRCRPCPPRPWADRQRPRLMAHRAQPPGIRPQHLCDHFGVGRYRARQRNRALSSTTQMAGLIVLSIDTSNPTK
jgi:hypothetical protein